MNKNEKVQKTANVSKTLLNALQNSMKTGQAVRIDFGNDVADDFAIIYRAETCT